MFNATNALVFKANYVKLVEGRPIIIIIIIMETYKAPLTRAQRRRTVHA